MKKITLLLLVAVMTSLGTLAQSISTSQTRSGEVVQNGAVGTASGITAATMFGNRAPANLTHSATQNIVPGTPTCNAGGILSAGDNGFYRVFDLASFGITDDYRVRSLEFGVETITTATTFPVTVNVYSGAPGTFPGALGTLRGSTTIDLTNADAGTVVSAAFDPMVEVIVPAGEELVYEVFANGDGATVFFPGSNGDGETDDSYLAAVDCALPLPATMTSMGFG